MSACACLRVNNKLQKVSCPRTTTQTLSSCCNFHLDPRNFGRMGNKYRNTVEPEREEASATYTNPTICPLLKLSSGRLLGRCLMVLIISGDVLGTELTSGADRGAATPGLLLWGCLQMRSASRPTPGSPPPSSCLRAGFGKGPAPNSPFHPTFPAV